LKRIWYNIVKIYISTGLFFFHKKIIVNGLNNIPRKGAVLFVSNHKNALIDPLLIATSATRNIHFLTRASAFKIKFVKWLLSTVNMIPIYRMRDGKETLTKNEEIFSKCYDILNEKKSLLIFPEGTHDIKRWVRPLSKGFTRIALGALTQSPELELHIVPIGLNYTEATLFGESVSVYYGKPILVNTYYNMKDINTSTLELKNIVHKKMKELTTHIEVENYDETITKLGNADFLNPIKINENLKDLSILDSDIAATKKPTILWRALKIVVAANSFLPILIYKFIEPNIKEIEFISTTKFAIGITAFPLFYFLQSLVVANFFGIQYGNIYALSSILMVLLLAKTK
jgi:1-acyl-sn-glycerol-3-phosphate acyltransferase